jgi:hypothetical protein
MIYVRESNEFIPAFEKLLGAVAGILEKEFTVVKNAKAISGTAFEKVICDKLNLLSKNTPFANKFEQTTAFAFPDIVAKVLENQWFGIEVKTSKDSWKCFGNSIFESTKIENLDSRIYLFFGKIGENLKCKWGKYEECIESINITHSPRYQINMNILRKSNLSIFSKMAVSYADFSEMPVVSKMTFVRAYKKKELGKNAALWWLPTNDDSDENERRLVIRLFSELTVSEKKEIRNLSLAYFPEIFSSELNKYEQLTKWTAANFGVISSSMRDTFSAGGKHTISIENKIYQVPRIYGHVEKTYLKIKEIITSTSNEELADFWGIEVNKNSDSIAVWVKLVSRNSVEYSREIKKWLTKLFE